MDISEEEDIASKGNALKSNKKWLKCNIGTVVKLMSHELQFHNCAIYKNKEQLWDQRRPDISSPLYMKQMSPLFSACYEDGYLKTLSLQLISK